MEHKHNTFAISRRSDIDIAMLLGGQMGLYKGNKKGCDILAANGKRIEVKASVLRKGKYAKFSISIDGEELHKRADFVLCVLYDEDYSVTGYWLIPVKDLPTWDTSISITLQPQRVHHRSWQPYKVTKEELIKLFSTKKTGESKNGAA